MNIAYLSADFGVPVFGFKGASIHVREMVEAFRRQGHSVCILSPAMDMKTENARNLFREAGPATGLPAVELLPVLPEDRHLQTFKDFERLDKFFDMKTRIRQEVRNLFYNMTLYERGRDYLHAHPVDFIYERYTLFSYAGIRMARDLHVPHLLEVNAPLAYEQEKMRGLEMKNLAQETERRIYRETDRLIVVSNRLKEFALTGGVPEERIRVLPNSVDPARFEKAMNEGSLVRSQYGLGDRCVIGFVGSLKPWHGTETLLQAFRQVRQRRNYTHVLIVGDGPRREALQKYVDDEQLSDEVTFTGKVRYDDIPRFLAAMDIAVAPYTPNENFYYSPIKIFEYMIMGKPVVAGSIGQVEDVIADHETGRLFPPGNIDQLAGVLEELIDNPARRQQLGEKARVWVKKERTWDNNAQQVVAMARELIENGVTDGLMD